MSQFVYRPATGSGWLAVASPGQLLVVHPQAADAALAVFGEGMGASATGFQRALDALTAGGLSATPPFALLEWVEVDDNRAVRAIVRGGVQVVVSAGGQQHTLDGTGVSTWTEQSFPQASAVEVVVVPAPEEAFAGEQWLPLSHGVALVARIAAAELGAGRAAVSRAEPPAAHTGGEVGESEGSEPVGTVSEATMVDFPPEPDSAQPTLDADARPTDDGYDYLFGETMYRNVAEAAVREADPDETDESAAAAPAAEPVAGDHDGMTIMTGDLKKLRADRTARAAEASPAAPPAAELYLDLSTGSREALDQPVLVGRAPTASKVSGGALPRLVAIPGDKDISRNHAQFVVEGGTVVVTDLHSRNGTLIIMPGKAPQQLRQGEPTAVIVGTVVDLGGGVTLTVREEA